MCLHLLKINIIEVYVRHVMLIKSILTVPFPKPTCMAALAPFMDFIFIVPKILNSIVAQ